MGEDGKIELTDDAQPAAEQGGLPLVTFALFAYNQEKYIREAVEGAFAQTYAPLEIILSDDCSTDRTFEIMQEMAAAYHGPHRVRVRRNEVNFGTALHVSAVASVSQGKLIVVAAGDDISLPLRTEKLTQAWIERGSSASAVHSKLIEISDADPAKRKEVSARVEPYAKVDAQWYIRHKALPFLSPTCAYSRSVFDSFPQLIGGSIIEDGALSVRACLIGDLLLVDDFLVLQRKPDKSAGTGYRVSDPDRWNNFVRSRIISYFTELRDLSFISSIDAHQRRHLERYFLTCIQGLSRCVLPPSPKAAILYRLKVASRLVFSYPSDQGLLDRIYFVLSFLELDRLRGIVFTRKILGYIRERGLL